MKRNILLIVCTLICSLVVGITLYFARPYIFREQVITGYINLLNEFPGSITITTTGITVQITYSIQNVQDMAGWQLYIQYDLNSQYDHISIVNNVFGAAGQLLENHDPDQRRILASVSVFPGQPSFSGSGTLMTVYFKLIGSVGSVANYKILVEPSNTYDPSWSYLINSDGIFILPLNYDTDDVTIIPEFSTVLMLMIMLVTTVVIVVCKKKSMYSRRL